MPATAWTALGVVLAAVAGGFATWLATKRTTSGTTDTSQASDLWTEGQSIRKELREEINTLRVRLAEAETKLADTLRQLAETNTKLVETNMKLMSAHGQADMLRDEVRELRRWCGQTNADVEAVSRELRVIKSDGPAAKQARREAES